MLPPVEAVAAGLGDWAFRTGQRTRNKTVKKSPRRESIWVDDMISRIRTEILFKTHLPQKQLGLTNSKTKADTLSRTQPWLRSGEAAGVSLTSSLEFEVVTGEQCRATIFRIHYLFERAGEDQRFGTYGKRRSASSNE